MAVHWTVRWFAALAVFALTTFAFSAYASAEQSPQQTSDSQPAAEQDADDQKEQSGEYTDDVSDHLHNTERGAEERPSPAERTPDYMLTITRGAFLGALLGGLIGGSIYILTAREVSPWVIGYTAAGGVFFGTLVGTMEVASREARARDARSATDPPHEEARQQGRSQHNGLSLPLLRLDF